MNLNYFNFVNHTHKTITISNINNKIAIYYGAIKLSDHHNIKGICQDLSKVKTIFFWRQTYAKDRDNFCSKNLMALLSH